MTVQGHRLVRTGIASSLVIGLLVVSAPAQAKAPAARLSVHAAEASFHVGSAVVVTGTVVPKASVSVALQRLVGKKWVVIAHAKPTAAGTFTFSVKAPAKAANWSVRAVRAKSGALKALTSPKISVHVVKPMFVVSAATPATVVDGSPIAVTGSVSPKASGTVLLQTANGKTWVTFASAKLTKTSTFSLSGLQPLGTHQVRVVKAAIATIAGGISKALTVTVQYPALTVTSTSLPDATVGLAYSAQLAASGGLPPYTWSGANLPAGFALSAGGILAGTPGAVLRTTATITLTDSRLVSATVQLIIRADLSPAARNILNVWGQNAYGEAGDGGTGDASSPRAVNLPGVVAMAGTNAASVAVRFDGTVWAWGQDMFGQLGDGGALASTGSTRPLRVAGLTGITALAAGTSDVFALAADGSVWGWGGNLFGSLGDGTSTPRLTPVHLPGLTGVMAIAAGDLNGYALKSDGTVWAWGDDANGQLGDGSNGIQLSPVQVHGLANVTAISAAHYTVAALLSDGTVRSWGKNDTGHLGDGTTTDRSLPVPVSGLAGISQIAVGQTNGYALLSNGTVKAWGYGAGGSLGNGSPTDALTPVDVSISGVKAIAAGGFDGYAVMADGTEKAWGTSTEGEIGDGTTTVRPTPVPVVGLSQVGAVAGSNRNGYAITTG